MGYQVKIDNLFLRLRGEFGVSFDPDLLLGGVSG